jgi:hypothetical protein
MHIASQRGPDQSKEHIHRKEHFINRGVSAISTPAKRCSQLVFWWAIGSFSAGEHTKHTGSMIAIRRVKIIFFSFIP